MNSVDAQREPGVFMRIARTAVPSVVSVALLAWVLDRIDIRLALDHVTVEVLLRFFPTLVLFTAVGVAIEAHSLHRVVAGRPEEAAPLPRRVAARLKAACYLIGVLNHLIGAGGLALLVSRRTGASFAVASGMVLLLALLDVGAVLTSIVLGGSLLQVDDVGLRLGGVAVLVAMVVAGFAFLRAPVDLGPLEVVRELPLFDAARLVPLPLLLELALVRLCMLVCFASLVGGLFLAFDVEITLLELVFGIGVMLAVAALPLAIAGIGTGQVVFVAVFRDLARDAELLAMSIVLTTSIIVTRALLGLLFAPEFTREAIAATRGEATDG
ncbi:MAG: hypothetical protein NXI30_16780 [bacterium]|nr:hypothetical protein [bacterium]